MQITSLFKGNSGPSKTDRKSKEFERIDADFGTGIQGCDEVDKNLATLDHDTQLKPPSLSNIKDSQLLVMGASGGAVVGGGLGLLTNVGTSWAAQPSIEVHNESHNVTRPVLVGNTEARPEYYREVKMYDQDGNPYMGKQLAGWHVQHQPSFRNENAGEYTTQRAEVNHGNITNPALDALGGMALGAGVGALLAGGVVVARKLSGKGEYVPTEERKTEGDLAVIAKMAGLGAAGGAAVGGLSGLLASGNSVTKTIVNQTPVMEDKVVGQIPQNYDVPVNQTSVPRPGTQDVHAQVPVMEGLPGFRHVKVTETKEVITAGGGLTLMTGIAGGAAAGAGLGVVAGVLTNVLRKTL